MNSLCELPIRRPTYGKYYKISLETADRRMHTDIELGTDKKPIAECSKLVELSSSDACEVQEDKSHVQARLTLDEGDLLHL